MRLGQTPKCQEPARLRAPWTAALACAALLGGAGCSQPAATEGPVAAAKPAGAPPAAPQARPASTGKRWLGVLASRESIDVSAPVSGRVLAVDAATGDAVAKGQLLARLDRSLAEQDLAMARSSATAAEADLQRAVDELNEAKARADRRRANPDFFSKEDLADAALREKNAYSSRDASQARVAEARARIKQLAATQGQLEVRAPFAGQVAERFAGPGSLVGPGTPILRLLAAGEPLVRAAVPPEDAPALKVGQPVRLQVRGTATRLAGTVTRIAPEIDAASQMVLIEIGLRSPGASGLRTGLVIDVEPG